jgi:hypothetical protein
MSELRDLLEGICPRIEDQLRPHLSSLFSRMIRSYLPQTWIFHTEKDTATLRVDASGKASAMEGSSPDSDVQIDWTHAQLVAALARQSSAEIPSGPAPSIAFQSDKGRAAFDFLRKRLGL